MSYVRSAARKYALDLSEFDKTDLHIHFPAGAIRKDGPSAGITIATALISLFRNEPVKKGLAMTGEITLSGQVLAIGGLKQKLIAAKAFHCRELIIPFENKKIWPIFLTRLRVRSHFILRKLTMMFLRRPFIYD